MGRGVWLPASLQEAMANDLHDQIKTEQFISDAEFWKKTNLENIYPPGGWPDEPQMHEEQRQAQRQRKRAGLFSDICLEARDGHSKLRKVADTAAAQQLQFGDMLEYAEEAFRTHDQDTTGIGRALDVLADYANKLAEDQASWC